ncbi:hypothetical protein CDL15_Pgr007765 [Punica granatum]|uniref:Uncharacterized protein n=1 Tax=Punica granatum TaxID=22663 RepID=A0A218X9U3_PUNGR|nr:hypothetical protein CDL15_Pgr007765 [Punica granatum]
MTSVGHPLRRCAAKFGAASQHPKLDLRFCYRNDLSFLFGPMVLILLVPHQVLPKLKLTIKGFPGNLTTANLNFLKLMKIDEDMWGEKCLVKAELGSWLQWLRQHVEA